MSPEQTSVVRSPEAVLETNKVIRNTYTLLSMTLLFSVVTAAISVALDIRSPGVYLGSVIVAFLMVWLVLPRTANSPAGLVVAFAFTGLLGFGLGPVLNAYLGLSNGPQLIGTALGGTGVIFLGLSGYALTTRKDFSFMGGFLMAGFLVVMVAALANIFMELPAVSLAISSVVILLMAGFILYDTSKMVHDPSTNYILMTVALYMNIYNLFVHLLSLLSAFSND